MFFLIEIRRCIIIIIENGESPAMVLIKGSLAGLSYKNCIF